MADPPKLRVSTAQTDPQMESGTDSSAPLPVRNGAKRHSVVERKTGLFSEMTLHEMELSRLCKKVRQEVMVFALPGAPASPTEQILLIIELRELKTGNISCDPNDLPDVKERDTGLANNQIKEILRSHIGEDILRSIDGTADLMVKYNSLKNKIRERDQAIESLGDSLFAAEERNSDYDIKQNVLRTQLERRDRMLEEQRKRFYAEFIALKEQLFLQREGISLDPRVFMLDLENLLERTVRFDEDGLQLAAARVKVEEYKERYEGLKVESMQEKKELIKTYEKKLSHLQKKLNEASIRLNHLQEEAHLFAEHQLEEEERLKHELYTVGGGIQEERNVILSKQHEWMKEKKDLVRRLEETRAEGSSGTMETLRDVVLCRIEDFYQHLELLKVQYDGALGQAEAKIVQLTKIVLEVNEKYQQMFNREKETEQALENVRKDRDAALKNLREREAETSQLKQQIEVYKQEMEEQKTKMLALLSRKRAPTRGDAQSLMNDFLTLKTAYEQKIIQLHREVASLQGIAFDEVQCRMGLDTLYSQMEQETVRERATSIATGTRHGSPRGSPIVRRGGVVAVGGGAVANSPSTATLSDSEEPAEEIELANASDRRLRSRRHNLMEQDSAPSTPRSRMGTIVSVLPADILPGTESEERVGSPGAPDDNEEGVDRPAATGAPESTGRRGRSRNAEPSRPSSKESGGSGSSSSSKKRKGGGNNSSRTTSATDKHDSLSTLTGSSKTSRPPSGLPRYRPGSALSHVSPAPEEGPDALESSSRGLRPTSATSGIPGSGPSSHSGGGGVTSSEEGGVGIRSEGAESDRSEGAWVSSSRGSPRGGATNYSRTSDGMMVGDSKVNRPTLSDRAYSDSESSSRPPSANHREWRRGPSILTSGEMERQYDRFVKQRTMPSASGRINDLLSMAESQVHDVMVEGKRKRSELMSERTQLLLSLQLLGNQLSKLRDTARLNIQSEMRDLEKKCHSILEDVSKLKFEEFVDKETILSHLDSQINGLLDELGRPIVPSNLIERLDMLQEDQPWEEYLRSPGVHQLDESKRASVRSNREYIFYQNGVARLVNQSTQTEVSWEILMRENQNLIVILSVSSPLQRIIQAQMSMIGNGTLPDYLVPYTDTFLHRKGSPEYMNTDEVFYNAQVLLGDLDRPQTAPNHPQSPSAPAPPHWPSSARQSNSRRVINGSQQERRVIYSGQSESARRRSDHFAIVNVNATENDFASASSAADMSPTEFNPLSPALPPLSKQSPNIYLGKRSPSRGGGEKPFLGLRGVSPKKQQQQTKSQSPSNRVVEVTIHTIPSE